MLLASSSSPKDILREEDVDVVVVVRRVAIRKLRADELDPPVIGHRADQSMLCFTVEKPGEHRFQSTMIIDRHC